HANRLFSKEVFEDPAVDLPGWCRQHTACAQFDHLREIARPLAEEKEKTELAHLRCVQMGTQPEDVGEIMRADLHGRFTDFEGCHRYRVPAAFDDADVQLRHCCLQLQRKREARKAAACHQHV